MAGAVKSTVNVSTVSLAESATGWSGASGGLDSETFKENANSYTYQTPKNGIGTCTFTPAANINMTGSYTNPHLFWTMRCDVMTFCEADNSAASPISTNSGFMLRVTDGSGNYKQWHMDGSDTWDGRWKTYTHDLTTTATHSSSGTLSLADVDIVTWYTDNSNSGTIRIIDNTWLDAVRYGTGIGFTSSTTEAFNFSDCALLDTGSTTWYGILEEVDGVIFMQGAITVGGESTGTTNFVSSAETVYVRAFDYNSADLELLFDEGASETTTVDIDDLVMKTVGTTGCKLTMTDAGIGTATIDGSTFIDMGECNVPVANLNATKFTGCGAITLGSGKTATDCTFTGNGQITHAGADMTGSTVSGYEGTADTSALIYDVNADPDGEMDNMTFTKGTALTHAIEFGTNVPSVTDSPTGTMTLRGCTFNGYGGGSPDDDAVFHFKDTTGSITLFLVNCTTDGTFSYKTDGVTVNIVEDPVDKTVTTVTKSGVPISGALVLLRAALSSPEGPFPVSVTVTIANSGATATVTHTAHGMATDDYVQIVGGSLSANQGVFQITKINDDSYSYTLNESPLPGGSPTGTITATFVALYGTTDGNGQVTTSRVYSANQAVEGWTRKSSTAPFYQEGPLTGEIDSITGYNAVAVMVSDE